MRNEPACALVETLGYVYAHTVYRMRIEMEEPPPAPERIEGVRIRAFAPGRDERVTYETVEDAFRDMRGRPQGSFEAWLAKTENERRDPGLWYLAEDEHSGEIVGVCLAWLFAGGQRLDWRRGGATAVAPSRAGPDASAHSVWRMLSPGRAGGGALRGRRQSTSARYLNTRAGMRVVQRISLYRKQLRPGQDYSTLLETAESRERLITRSAVQRLPADERAAVREKGLMNVGASFIAYVETAKAIEPGESRPHS